MIKPRTIIKYLRLTTLLLITLIAEGADAATTPDDSVWTDPISGSRVHLQRLAPTDTLVRLKPQPLKALAYDLGINAAVLGWDYFVQDRPYARISKSVLKNNFRNGFVWDNDSFSGNQFSHPYHGSMFYNAARENGMSYAASLIYPLIGSATWELLCETNPPAMNDLLSTGIGGSAIGEVTHRTSDIFFDNSKTGANRVVREIIGTALNPIRGLQRILSGDMWHVSPYRGKRISPEPYTFEVGTGVRHMTTRGGLSHGMTVPFLNFTFNYGDRFDTSESHPYDHFRVNLLANLSDQHPTIGELDIVGRIANKELECSNDWNIDLGLYQLLKYIDHYGEDGVQEAGEYSIISEAISFGAGIYAERHTDTYSLSNDFIASAIAFGGSTSDYFTHRRYNYGSGFSLRNNLTLALNRRITLGNQTYFMRLFTPKGLTPEEMAHKEENNIPTNTWGDRGCNSVMTSNTYLRINLFQQLKLDLSYSLYHRRSNYKYHPSVQAKSYEYKIGLTYSI